MSELDRKSGRSAAYGTSEAVTRAGDGGAPGAGAAAAPGSPGPPRAPVGERLSGDLQPAGGRGRIESPERAAPLGPRIRAVSALLDGSPGGDEHVLERILAIARGDAARDGHGRDQASLRDEGVDGRRGPGAQRH
ncbi:hypothetical protein BE21_07785 [Sorangium cellulosum]|uniref:Uncharacterized protein n=1 Tax=Sorangium cellulosum TaxID=56 RepID=A0A150U3C9_SORCE|nr:hypothetical protein BE21_07785 [Sorangium cellulosum]